VVEEGSTIITDGNKAYVGLKGYEHEVQISGSGGRSKDDTLRLFHIAAGNLKAWILGTHHGRIESKNLQAYLNEFTFRFNRRRNLAAAFQTLLGLVPGAGSFTYKDIYADEPMHPNPSRKRNPKPSKRWEWKVRR
jgi:hypothetical protein